MQNKIIIHCKNNLFGERQIYMVKVNFLVVGGNFFALANNFMAPIHQNSPQIHLGILCVTRHYYIVRFSVLYN